MDRENSWRLFTPYFRPGAPGWPATLEQPLWKKMEFDNSKIKSAIAMFFEKVREGDAPDEVVAFCQSMSPNDTKFWLHGFFTAICKQKVLLESEFFDFLVKMMS